MLRSQGSATGGEGSGVSRALVFLVLAIVSGTGMVAVRRFLRRSTAGGDFSDGSGPLIDEDADADADADDADADRFRSGRRAGGDRSGAADRSATGPGGASAGSRSPHPAAKYLSPRFLSRSSDSDSGLGSADPGTTPGTTTGDEGPGDGDESGKPSSDRIAPDWRAGRAGAGTGTTVGAVETSAGSAGDDGPPPTLADGTDPEATGTDDASGPAPDASTLADGTDPEATGTDDASGPAPDAPPPGPAPESDDEPVLGTTTEDLGRDFVPGGIPDRLAVPTPEEPPRPSRAGGSPGASTPPLRRQGTTAAPPPDPSAAPGRQPDPPGQSKPDPTPEALGVTETGAPSDAAAPTEQRLQAAGTEATPDPFVSPRRGPGSGPGADQVWTSLPPLDQSDQPPAQEPANDVSKSPGSGPSDSAAPPPSAATAVPTRPPSFSTEPAAGLAPSAVAAASPTPQPTAEQSMADQPTAAAAAGRSTATVAAPQPAVAAEAAVPPSPDQPASAPAVTEPRSGRFFYGWIVVGAVFVIMAISSGIGFYNASVILSAATDELSASVGSVSGATGLFFAIGGLTGFLFAKRMDTVDIRWFFFCGGIVGAAALVGLRWVTSVAGLYVFFGLFGVGFSLAGLVPGTTLVTRWFDRRRSVALSVASTGLSVGGIVITPISAWLIDQRTLSGASPYLAAIWVVGIIPIALLLVRSYPADKGLLPDGGPPAEDPMPAAALPPVADSTPVEAAAPAPTPMPAAPEVAVTTAEFEPRPTEQIDDGVAETTAGGLPGLSFTAARTTRFFIALCVAYAVIFFGQVGAIAQLFNMVLERADTATASTSLSMLAFTSVLSRLAGGAIVMRLPTRTFTAALAVVQAVALVLLAVAGSSLTLILTSAFLGVSIGNLLMLQPLLLAEVFGVAQYGRIYSFNQLFGTIGVAGGPFVLGLLRDAYDYRTAFLVGAAASFVGFVFIVLAGSSAGIRSRWQVGPATP